MYNFAYSAVATQAHSFHSSGILSSSLDEDFNKAKEQSTNLSEDPGNEVKLQMYSLFKQVRHFSNYMQNKITSSNQRFLMIKYL